MRLYAIFAACLAAVVPGKGVLLIPQRFQFGSQIVMDYDLTVYS